MGFPKAVGYAIVLLAIFYSLEKRGYMQSVKLFFEELMDKKPSYIYTRDKRAVSSNSTDFLVQAVVNISEQDLQNLRALLNTFPFPINVNSVEITSIKTSTVCSPNLPGYQCRCEPNFAWSYNSCLANGACDAFVDNTCGCINALPANNQYCQLNTSQTVTTLAPSATTKNVTLAPSTTPKNVPSVFTFVVDVRVPVTVATPDVFFTDLRSLLSSYPMPISIYSFLTITSVNFTTGCYPNTTGGLQCQCEQQFAWPCNTCQSYSSCNMNTTEICSCIYGLPSDGFCKPITDVTKCPTTPTTVTSLIPPITPSPPPQVKNSSFTMDLPYNSSFNDPNSKVYKDINNAIQTQCHTYISALVSAKIIGFRSGSTVVDYSISAPSLPSAQIDAVKAGIFTQLGSTYPIIFDSSTPLQFSPQSVYYGQTVTVTCGPPPQTLNFSSSWTAEWSRDGSPLPPDSRYSTSTNYIAGTATLTMTNVISTETGSYACKLKQADGSSFRQISTLTVNAAPIIQVSPVQTKFPCGSSVTLNCSVNSPYQVGFTNFPGAGTGGTISYIYSITDCTIPTRTFTCQETTLAQFKSTITLTLFTGPIDCQDPIYGDGKINDIALGPCGANQVGNITKVCTVNGWEEQNNACVLNLIYDLLQQSMSLTNITLPTLLNKLSNVTQNYTQEVVGSPATINATVQIFINVANASSMLSISISNTSMTDVLTTSGILTTAQASWKNLNTNFSSENKSISSEFLQSLEDITRGLTKDSFDIVTTYILLKKTTFNNYFSSEFNSSVEVAISEANGGNNFLTVITFSSMDNVLPARNQSNSTSNVINGKVVLVQSNSTVNNISLTFNVTNNTLTNPQCVFWNFSLFSGQGGWDNTGCMLVSNNKTVTCNCSHLTSFSILMSPVSIDDPVLDYITYIGVSISMVSLIICLIIEAVIWRKIRNNTTSYLRHVSIVNIAVSLLIADIWFIIGAAISAAEDENKPACSTATFFIHYFYLALFFWMLASALLLLYRTISVFDGGLSKASMLAIGFSLGYGAPLIIVIITIAVTAPKQEYIQGANICWLNWNESKALLAFVIPALTIVLINFIILLVVIYKMLRRRVGGNAHADERNVLVVIARTLAVLTPFFGITWGLGVGTMVDPYNKGLLIVFALFNSLQGFFILVFGTLLDKKVRSELAIKSQSSSGGTRSTSAGNSSSGGLGFFRNWRRQRDGYNVSGASGASHSYSST